MIPSATDATVAPAGSENLFVLVPMPADPSLGHGGVDGGGDPRIRQVELSFERDRHLQLKQRCPLQRA